MTISELKKKDDYCFECNLSKRDAMKNVRKLMLVDEWGSALLWLGEDIGVEYNFCIDDECNSSAIYKMDFNKEDDCMETDYDTFEHYEIDFSNRRWKRELEDAMCKALIKFFNL